MLHALEVSEGNPSLHKALPRVNWQRIGVWGKSMVCAYGARESSNVGNTPSLYITGTSDDSSSPADVMYQEFDSNPAESKVFLNLENVAHMGNLMDDWLAKFFVCHVGAQDTCGEIYGSDHAICQAAQYADNGCVVEGGGVRRLTTYV